MNLPASTATTPLRFSTCRLLALGWTWSFPRRLTRAGHASSTLCPRAPLAPAAPSRSLPGSFRFLLAAACVLFLAGRDARAQQFTFSDIADTNAHVPGQSGNFTGFNLVTPSVSGNNVAFEGTYSGGSGVYTDSVGTTAVGRVADTSTTAPGHGNFSSFTPFNVPLSISGNTVSFYGNYDGGNGAGIYTGAAGTTGANLVADLTTGVPFQSGNFTGFSFSPSIGGTSIGFYGTYGSGNGSGSGIYTGNTSYQGAANRVADQTTTVPGQAGNFTGFGRVPAASGGSVAFLGIYNGGAGVYTGLANVTGASKIADFFTTIPGQIGTFTSFGSPVLSGNNVAFTGYSSTSNTGFGVYTGTAGTAGVVRAADQTTVAPGHGALTFSAFNSCAISGANVAFAAEYGGSSNSAGSGLFVESGGKLFDVLSRGDTLFGGMVGQIRLGDFGYDGNELAFYYELTNGASGIAVANVMVPEPATSLGGALLLGLGFAAFRRRRLPNLDLAEVSVAIRTNTAPAGGTLASRVAYFRGSCARLSGLALVGLFAGLLPPGAAAQIFTVDQANGNSPYALNSDSSYTLVFDGYNGVGAINHTAGNLTVSNVLEVGYNSGSNGTYNLSGTGTISVADEYAGDRGTGSFSQSSGTNTITDALVVGYNSGSTGGFTLSGTGVLSAPREQISANGGRGTFTQSGGTNTVTSYLLLAYSGGSGTYNLNGGTLQTLSVTAGNGTSIFNFNGGTLQATGSTALMSSLTAANVQVGGALIDSNGSSATISQKLLHDTTANAPATDGGLTKLGTGTLTLSGANTYTGPTLIDVGTLLVNGTQTGTGIVTVRGPQQVTVQGAKATLGGTGTLAAPVNVTTGAINPGGNAGADGSAANVGKLTTGALTLNSTASAMFDVSSGTVYDQLQANGNVDLGGAALTLIIPAGATFGAGQVLDLVHANGGLLTGTFAGLDNGGIYISPYNSQAFTALYTPTDFELVPVPEPATWLGGVGMVVAAGILLRRRSSGSC